MLRDEMWGSTSIRTGSSFDRAGSTNNGSQRQRSLADRARGRLATERPNPMMQE
jgi:hypothetical protein